MRELREIQILVSRDKVVLEHSCAQSHCMWLLLCCGMIQLCISAQSGHEQSAEKWVWLCSQHSFSAGFHS